MKSRLETKLNYQFKNPRLLRLALTHRSAHSEHNERLEFIGDGILNFVIAEALYHAHPTAAEGDLSRWRAALVQGENLAKLALSWELDQVLILGPGEIKTQGQHRPSILANTFEAILGAIYLDAGFEQTKTLIHTTFTHQLTKPEILKLQKDAKTSLQEYLQAKGLPIPRYELISIQGQDHASEFTMRCCIDSLELESQGKAASKRKAEQHAAAEMILKLNIKT